MLVADGELKNIASDGCDNSLLPRLFEDKYYDCLEIFAF